MAGACVAADVAFLLGLLHGADVEPEPCTRPRTWRVLLRHDRPGVITAELTAEVCAEHELLISASAEHQRSWKLPTP
jgi:hypothetical protein